MSRTISKPSKTTEKKLDNFLKTIGFSDDFKTTFLDIVHKDLRMIKECSEKSIVDFYIEGAKNLLDSKLPIGDEFWNKLKLTTRTKLVKKYASNKTFDNNIDIYFNAVKREYILHPQQESEDLAFVPENKDIFVKNNLKLVIDCAKRYRNLGLPFEDLIQIGNYGLLIAFEKFDTERANLRYAIIKDINNCQLSLFTKQDAEDIIRKNFSYSKTLDSTINKIPVEGFSSKGLFIDWANEYIKKPAFSSVGFAWIRATILSELSKYSTIIRIPKSIQKDDNASTSIIRLDSINPHTDDCYHDNQMAEVANEEFAIEDESVENIEKQNMFKDLVDRLLCKLDAIDRRIIKKKFGIGIPVPMSVNEIAENEGISSNKVKYAITNSMKIITNSLPENEKQIISDMLR